MTDPIVARDREPELWLLGVTADACSAEERAALAERWAFDADRPDRLLLVTCHRVELYGAGPHRDALAAVGAAGTAWSGAALALAPRRGRAVARHAFRLAAGLESAVVGEDQVLHQVRDLLAVARARSADARLVRLLELAIGVGRRARAAREGHVRTLAGEALDWLAARTGGRDALADPSLAGRRVLVVGTGPMGRLLALESKAQGAHVAVASRSFDHAQALARQVGGHPLDLADAASMLPQVDAAAVALAGPWHDVAAHHGPSVMVRSPLPPIVDLSSPSALPESVRSGLGSAFAGIDTLFRLRGMSGEDEVYARAAEWLVDEASDQYVRWSAGRASLYALRRLRGSAEARRAAELERLLRRLPDLGPRERALLEAFSQQLVASIIHAPTAALRDDLTGEADRAARLLFGLADAGDAGDAPADGASPGGGDVSDDGAAGSLADGTAGAVAGGRVEAAR